MQTDGHQPPPQALTADQLLDVAAPLALRAMAAGAAPVKAAAAAAAAALLRALRRPAQRAELLARLLRDFARGRSCWRRAVFVDSCAAALQHFSARCGTYTYAFACGSAWCSQDSQDKGDALILSIISCTGVLAGNYWCMLHSNKCRSCRPVRVIRQPVRP